MNEKNEYYLTTNSLNDFVRNHGMKLIKKKESIDTIHFLKRKGQRYGD